MKPKIPLLLPLLLMGTLPAAAAGKKRTPTRPAAPLYRDGDRWVNAYWGLEVLLPGFPYPPPAVPADPSLALFASDARLHPEAHVNVSVVVEETARPETPPECARRRLLDAIERRQPSGLRRTKAPPPGWTFQENATPAQMGQMGLQPGAQAVPRLLQFYAYFTRGSTCFELHMTNARLPWQPLNPETASKMAAIAASFKLADVGVGDLGTLSLASELGMSPMDPDFYDRLGDAARTQMQDADKTESYYRSELILGPTSPLKELKAREALGRIALAKGESERARAQFERTLDLIARKAWGGPRRNEAEYGLACAEALSDQTEQAKAKLESLLKGTRGKARLDLISRLEYEPSLAKLRSEPSYKNWLAAFKAKGRR